MWEILAGLIEDLAKGLLSPRGEGGGREGGGGGGSRDWKTIGGEEMS